MFSKQRFNLFLISGVLVGSCGTAAGVTLNQLDSFQGDSDNWARGTALADGGPTGTGDGFLLVSSGTFGGRSRLITFNQAQWTGDFAAAGVGAVAMSLKNFGDSTLPIRITIRDQTGGQAVPGYSSTDAFMLPADGQWHTANFNLTAADMTPVNPFDAMLDPFSVLITKVADFRILSAAAPAIIGDAIDAQIGIDKVTAVPPPVSSWTGASSTSWADSGNWTGAAPGATSGTTNNDTANFNQNAAHSPLVVDSARNIENITFDTANVNSLVIGTLGGQSLLLTTGGTVQTTSTVISAQTINAPLILEGDYKFTSGAAATAATLTFGGKITPAATSGNTTLTLNGSNLGANTIAGALTDNGSGILAVTKGGPGLWILSGANSYSGPSTVTAGTLRFNIAAGTPNIATGATATVASGATLELAGAISALGSSGGNRAHLINDSTAPGLLVTGMHQAVGNIDGNGTTQVNAGSDLTANHIVQSALVIAGAVTSRGLVAIDASDASGNPLVSLSLLAAPNTDTPVGVGGEIGDSLNESPVAGSATLSALGVNSAFTAVPEPSSLLLVIGGLAAARTVLRRSRSPRLQQSHPERPGPAT